MPRYIDANNIRLTGLTFTDVNKNVYFSLSDIRKAIEQTPTADVVEVVRCKDCKYYRESEVLAPNKFCFRLRHPTENRQIGYNFSSDDFCSHGERKEQE